MNIKKKSNINKSDIKIIIRLFGGIGNQLFIYAAGRRMAYVNNCELVIDNKSGFLADKIYKRKYQLDKFKISGRIANKSETLVSFFSYKRYIIKFLNLFKNFENKNYFIQNSIEFDKRFLNIKPTHDLYLEGYWQSQNYFIDIQQIIRQDLEILPPIDFTNLQIVERIRKENSVAVHFRFFEMRNQLQTVHSNNVALNYYNKALNVMEDKLIAPHYFLFTDNPEIKLDNVNLPNNRYTLICNNNTDETAYADLWLMSSCKNFIIANSTFSWWAAWLSKSKDKIIISPGTIIGSLSAWGFDGLIPESWIVIEE